MQQYSVQLSFIHSFVHSFIHSYIHYKSCKGIYIYMYYIHSNLVLHVYNYIFMIFMIVRWFPDNHLTLRSLVGPIVPHQQMPWHLVNYYFQLHSSVSTPFIHSLLFLAYIFSPRPHCHAGGFNFHYKCPTVKRWQQSQLRRYQEQEREQNDFMQHILSVVM